MTSGVYMLYCGANGRAYVGQSRNLEQRERKHLYDLKKERHHNREIEADVKRFGPVVFTFCILQHAAPDQLDTLERHWIKQLESNYAPTGYNFTPGGVAKHNPFYIKWNTRKQRLKINEKKRCAPVDILTPL